ncbi:MAG: hypothetical protein ACC660_02030, partial [Acidimicrobiales bacterium]
FSTDIVEDLSRRDFTINAMAIELPNQELMDPFGGLADLEAARLKTPLDPEVSFTDDPLRMLRAARFTAGYGLQPTIDLVGAMQSLAERIEVVSAERVRDELDRLLGVDQPGAGLVLLAQTGLLELVLPELQVATVTHSAEVVDSLAADPVIRLAALLFGCEPPVVPSRLHLLRHSKDRRRDTLLLVAAAARLVAGEITDPPSLRRWIGEVAARRDDARALAIQISEDGRQGAELSRELENRLGDELDDLSPALSGKQVMAELGLPAGKRVGEALAFLQDLRFDHGPMDPDDARRRLRAWWREQGG